MNPSTGCTECVVQAVHAGKYTIAELRGCSWCACQTDGDRGSDNFVSRPKHGREIHGCNTSGTGNYASNCGPPGLLVAWRDGTNGKINGHQGIRFWQGQNGSRIASASWLAWSA